MRPGMNSQEHTAMAQYVDAMVDIMNGDECTGSLDKPEIVFLGPDENTADKMDPSCLQSKTRNFKQQKAFTTGKSPTLGGVPHDTQGMTTRSVRQ